LQLPYRHEAGSVLPSKKQSANEQVLISNKPVVIRNNPLLFAFITAYFTSLLLAYGKKHVM